MLDSSDTDSSSQKVAVYTANFGNKDTLKSPKNLESLDSNRVDFVCVTDNASFQSDVYQNLVVESTFGDITKNARSIKINGFDGMEDYDIAIWHDSSIQMDCDKINELISYAKEFSLSTFRHGREDVYLEAIACIETNKDRPVRIAQQMKRYHQSGLKAHSGLFETGIIVLNVKKFMGSELQQAWWNEINHGSRRDQISLPYAEMVSNTKIGILEGSGHQNPYSEYIGHEYEHYIDSSNSWFSELNLLKKLAIRYIYKLRHRS